MKSYFAWRKDSEDKGKGNSSESDFLGYMSWDQLTVESGVGSGVDEK